MKKRMIMLVVAVMLLGLTACNHVMNNTERNTLRIESDGITDISVEDYSNVDFTEEDLRAYIDAQVTAFTEKNSGTVAVKDLSIQGTTVKLAMNYDTIVTYNAFNGTAYDMTPANLWNEEIKDDVFTAADGAKLDKAAVEGLLAEDGVNVLQIAETTDVVLSGKVLAYSGCTMLDEKTVQVTDETAVIIYK